MMCKRLYRSQVDVLCCDYLTVVHYVKRSPVHRNNEMNRKESRVKKDSFLSSPREVGQDGATTHNELKRWVS